MKKNIANTITLFRIMTATILLFFNSLSDAFLCLYMFCGFTDLIDGPIARMTKSASLLGAKLDSLGDGLLYVATAKTLLLQKLIAIEHIIWIVISILLLILSGCVAKRCHGKFFFVHSFSGKAMGVSFFLLPFAFHFSCGYMVMSLTCFVSTWAAIEVLLIQIKSRTPEPDIASYRALIKKQQCPAYKTKCCFPLY